MDSYTYTYLDSTNVMSKNAYIHLTIFHERDLYGVYLNL